VLAFIVWEKVLGVLGMWTAGRGSLLEVPEDGALGCAVGARVMLGGAECGSWDHQPSKAGLPVPERAGMRFSGHDVYVPNKYEKCLSVVRLRLSSADNGKIFFRCRYNIPLSV
jgi:hypothetical protein